MSQENSQKNHGSKENANPFGLVFEDDDSSNSNLQIDSEELITSDDDLDDFLASLVSKNKDIEEKESLESMKEEVVQGASLLTQSKPNKNDPQKVKLNQKPSLLNKMKSSLGTKRRRKKDKSKNVTDNNNKYNDELVKKVEEKVLAYEQKKKKEAKKKSLALEPSKNKPLQKTVVSQKQSIEKQIIPKKADPNISDSTLLAKSNFEKLDLAKKGKVTTLPTEVSRDEPKTKKLDNKRDKLKRELQLTKALKKVEVALVRLNKQKQIIEKEIQIISS